MHKFLDEHLSLWAKQSCIILFKARLTSTHSIFVGARQTLRCRLDKGVNKIANKKDVEELAT